MQRRNPYKSYYISASCCINILLISVYIAYIDFYFLIKSFKIHRKLLTCNLLVHVSASWDHHQAPVNWRKPLQGMGSQVIIFACCYCMLSYFKMYAHSQIPHTIVVLWHSRLCSYVCDFSWSGMCQRTNSCYE